MKNEALKLGDKVSGMYYDIPFIGILTSYDLSGNAYVELEQSIVVCRSTRNHLCIDLGQRKYLKLIQSGDVTQDQIETMPSSVLGGAFLK